MQALFLIRDIFKGINNFENFYNKENKNPWFFNFNEENYFVTFHQLIKSKFIITLENRSTEKPI